MTTATSDREKILTRLRTVSSQGSPAETVPTTKRETTTKTQAHQVLEGDHTKKQSLVDQFVALAEAEAATTARVTEAREVPAAVSKYLRAQGLSGRLILSRGATELEADWYSAPGLDCGDGPLAPDGDTVVTGCYAAIAEAGALVMLSSAAHPAELNFLSATHIVVVPVTAIVDSFETFWSRLRGDFPTEGLPRMLNFIVGPSRTADLGVPSKLGAHGPARVHIILVG